MPLTIESFGPLVRFFGDKCNACNNVTATLQPALYACAGCNVAVYCGEKCQESHYETHAVECEQIGSLLGELPPIMLWEISKYLSRADMQNFRLLERKLTLKLGYTWVGAVEWAFTIENDTLEDIPMKYRAHMRKLRIAGRTTGEELTFIGRNLKALTDLRLERYNDRPEYLTKFPVTHIAFDDEFEYVLYPGVLPATLVHIEFGSDFNHPLNSQNLPPTLRRLYLRSDEYDFDVNDLPDSIEYLYLKNNDDECPVTSDHPITKLPRNLKTIVFGECEDNVSITTYSVFPKHLETLDLANHVLPAEDFGLLPGNIQNLNVEIDRMFVDKIRIRNLPTNLVNLNINVFIDDADVILYTLPANLQTLDNTSRSEFHSNLKFEFKQFPKTLLSMKLKKFNITNVLPVFNSNLRLLDLRDSIVPQFTIGVLSELNQLNDLTLPQNFNSPLRFLPNSLQRLEILTENAEAVLQKFRANFYRGNARVKAYGYTKVNAYALFPITRIAF